METLEIFAHRAWQDKGVADCCLYLQDRYGADCCMLLYCLWAAARGISRDADLFGRACNFSRAWHHRVVRPLRHLRRALRHPAIKPVRALVLRLELSAERYQLRRLGEPAIRQVSASPGEPRHPRALLERYLQRAGIRLDDEGRARLASLPALLTPS